MKACAKQRRRARRVWKHPAGRATRRPRERCALASRVAQRKVGRAQQAPMDGGTPTQQRRAPASPGLALAAPSPPRLPGPAPRRRPVPWLRRRDSDGSLPAESPAAVCGDGARGRRPWMRRLRKSSRTRSLRTAASPPPAALSLRERGPAAYGSRRSVPYGDMAAAPRQPRPRKPLPHPARCEPSPPTVTVQQDGGHLSPSSAPSQKAALRP